MDPYRQTAADKRRDAVAERQANLNPIGRLPLEDGEIYLEPLRGQALDRAQVRQLRLQRRLLRRDLADGRGVRVANAHLVQTQAGRTSQP